MNLRAKSPNGSADLPGHRPGVGPDMTVTSSVRTAPTSTELSIKQYSRRKVLAVWVAAALPMAALAWLAAPALAGPAAHRPTLHPGAHRGAVRWVGVAVPTRCDPRHEGAEQPA